MPVNKWHADNGDDIDFDFDINPASDTNWMEEPVYAEHHCIGAKNTVLQINGYKSRPRVAEGVTKSGAIRTYLKQLHRKSKTWTLTDHHEETDKVFITELTFQEILDVSNLNNTFKWRMKLIRRPN